MSQKILVTGGAGFIGSNFIHHYLSKHPQTKIYNLDALTYAGNKDNLRDIEDHNNYSFIHADICDQHLVDKLVSEVDTIVHFAAESHVDRSLNNPQLFLQTNVIGTQVLLDSACKHHIKRFHHISTDEVFGSLELDSDQLFTEDTAYDPRSPYSASKAASDHLVRAYGHSFGLEYTISNCSNNYGEYQFPEKLFSLSITNLLEGKKVPVYGDGLNVRDWLYVQDHCHAIDLILQSGKAGETYLIGGLNKDYSNIEIIKIILSIIGESEDKIEFVKDRPGHDRRYAVDWSKIKNQLDWTPSVTLTQGLEKTIAWYKSHQDWWQPLKEKNKKYYKKQYKNI